MPSETTLTVRELVATRPHAAAILEKAGVEYCCHGDLPLEEACAAAGVDSRQLLKTIEDSWKQPGQVRDWNSAPLADLIEHIVKDFHERARADLERILPLADRVAKVHVERHPELTEVVEEFGKLRGEFTMHMRKEELMLFPWIKRLETAAASGQALTDTAPFGSVKNPIAFMVEEHRVSGDELEKLRQLCHGYQPPEDACSSFQALYAGLKQFEADMHHHVHLENNILFPRAIKLEERA